MQVATHPWLPDFCRVPRLAACLGIAQLVVLVIALAPRQSPAWSWEELLAASAFAHWVALTSAVLLCKLRGALLRPAAPIGVLLALLLTALVAMFGAWSLQQIDLGLATGLTLPAGNMREFVFGTGALSALITAVALRYFYVREQWQAQVQAHAQAAMEALQARIRPHFLFNSMNTIASLVRHDPVTAEHAIEDLSDLFRAALGADRGDATLAEEVEIGRRYLAIEALRLGPRLRVHWDLPEPLPVVRMPRLILQPLLENAVLHGIAHLEAGGEISIRLRETGTRLQLCVSNPAPDLAASRRDVHNGHAQDSIARRLQHHFGPSATLLARRDGDAYVCELDLPLP